MGKKHSLIFLLMACLNGITSVSFSQQQARDLLQRGIEDYALGFILSAKENLDACIQMDSNLADAYYYRGMCLEKGFRSDFNPFCLNDYAKCIELDSSKNYVHAYFYLANGMAMFGNFFQLRYPQIVLIEQDAAITMEAYFRKAYALNPSVEMAEKIGSVYYMPDFVNTVLDLFDSLLLDHPNNQKIILGKVQLYRSIIMDDKAIELLIGLLDQDKKNGEIYSLLVTCLRDQKARGKEIDQKFLDKMIKKEAKYTKTED